jgi:hypothetical protein
MALQKLPNKQDMLERLLRGVSNNAYLQENVYPTLLKYAGQEICPVGLVMVIGRTFEDTRQALPDKGEETLFPLAPLIIEALVDDRTFTEAAKRHWDTMMTS